MKKYFISNKSSNDSTNNNVEYFNLALNFLLGFTIVFFIIFFTFGRNIKISFDYLTCVVFLIILFILYNIFC